MRYTVLALLALGLGTMARDLPPREPVFLLHQIGNDRAEGVAVLDMNRDGQPDVASGAYWYEAPTWTKHEYREAKTGMGKYGEFVADCGEFAMDVNHDGYPDIVSANWFEDGIFYFENPKQADALWKKVQVTSSKDTEGIIARDVDGDGQLDILPSHYSKQPMFWLQIKDGKFTRRPVSDTISIGHGVGLGDVDGDGKPDILGRNGWFKQVDLAKDQWQHMPEWQLDLAGIAMWVYDVNGDGLNDVIYSNGHNYGLFWMEQKKNNAGRRTWVRHVIDDSYSQIHNLLLVDLNGDGKPEILAGKRYRGHSENDPGSFDPLAIYYYDMEVGKEPKFTRHTVAYNAIAGAGTQFVVQDMDGDGDLDIVVAGKTGQYWFENLTVNTVPWQKRDILFNRYPAR